MTTHTGAESDWVTSTTNPDTAPNDAFGPDAFGVGNTELISPNFVVAATGSTMSFRNLYNMAPGTHGMVLEISINGAPYQDILTAGGSFSAGPYSGTITALGGRPAWTGLSGGTTSAPTYITTAVNLPAAANGQIVRMKWRVATDANGFRLARTLPLNCQRDQAGRRASSRSQKNSSTDCSDCFSATPTAGGQR